MIKLYFAQHPGTFTMYAALYGAFALLGPKLDEKLAGPQLQLVFENDEVERPSLESSLTNPPLKTLSPFQMLKRPEGFNSHTRHSCHYVASSDQVVLTRNGCVQ